MNKILLPGVNNFDGNHYLARCLFLLLTAIIFVVPCIASTITWNGNSSSAYSVSSNWSSGTVPGSADVIIIPNNPTGGRFPILSIGNNASISGISINTGASLILNGGILTVAGSVTVNGTLVNAGASLFINGAVNINSGGIMTCSSGLIHLNSDPNINASNNLILNSGSSVNQTGGRIDTYDLQLTSTSSFTQSFSGSLLTINHDYKNTGGNFYSIGGVVEWIGVASISVVWGTGTNQFYDILIDNGADPNFDDANGNYLSIGGNWINNSTVVSILNKRITTVTFNGTGDQTIGGSNSTEFHNIVINKTSGSVFLGTNCTLDKNASLDILSGTFDMGVNTLNPTMANGSGILTVNSTGILKVGGSSGGRAGSNFPDLFTHYIFNSGSTVEYNGASTQTIYGENYSNLILTNPTASGSVSKITTSNSAVNGTLTVNSNVVLTPCPTCLISGNGTLTGTGTVQTNRVIATNDFVSQYSIQNKSLLGLTVDYCASLPQFVNALNYGNLTVSGTRTTNSVTYSPTGTVGIAGVFLPSATFSTGNHIVTSSTLDFNGAQNQSIPAFTFNNLAASGGSYTKTAVGQIVVNGTIATALTTTLDMNTYAMTGTIGTVTNLGIIRTQSTSTTPLPSGRSWNGLVEYYSPTGGQTGVVGTFTNLKINNATGGTTAAGNITVSTNLDMAAGSLYPGINTLTLNGNVTRTSGSIVGASSNITYSGTSAQTIAAGSLTGSLVNYTMNNSAGVTSSNSVSVSGTWSLTAGTLNIGTGTVMVSGVISKSSGVVNAPSGTVGFNSSIAQTIPLNSINSPIAGLTIDNPAGLTVYQNFTVSSALNMTSGILNMNNTTLTVGGIISGTGAGKLKGSTTSNLVIASSGTVGTFYMDQATDESTNALSNLSVSGGAVTLGNKINLFNVLTMSGGTFDMDNKNVVLKSLPANTARIAPVTGSVANYNNVTVERYFPDDSRRFRLVSPGVTTSGSIRDNWMEGGINTEFWGANAKVNPKPGYGTNITGAGNNSNGFDLTQTSQSSVYTYAQASDSWVSIPNTSGKLDINKGYLIFIRGDRSVDMTLVGAPISLAGTATTLRATGTIKVGSHTFSSLASSGLNSLVSNPYASPVNWSSIYANNSSKFEDYYTYWDPKVGVRGSFVTVTSTGEKNNISAAATTEIQGGQSFFVTTRKGISTPAITLNESDKSTTSNINVFRTSTNTSKLYTSLFFYDARGKRYNADGVMVSFNDKFSPQVNEDDALQISNWDEDIAIKRNLKLLSIESRPRVKENDSIFLQIARLKQQKYEWQFDPVNFNIPPSLKAFLIDKFTREQTEISLKQPTIVTFNITADVASADSGRFMIIFKAEVEKPTEFLYPKELVSIYPNPINGTNVHLQFKNIDKGQYNLKLINMLGQQVYTKQIYCTGGSLSLSINEIQFLRSGIYSVIISNSKRSWTFPVEVKGSY